jgi:SHS2 domain-containing protein
LRLSLPQPFEELSHTADVGVAARGDTAAEALARLVLALAALLCGGGEVAPGHDEVIRVEGAGDLAQTAVAVLREVLYRFATRREIPRACEVRSLAPGGAEVVVEMGPHDPARHAAGTDVKAVTYHAARLAPEEGGWRAQVLLDV